MPKQPAKQQTDGFALIETVVVASVISALLFVGTVTIQRGVQQSVSAMNATERSMRARRALDEMESRLSTAGLSTLECVRREPWMGDDQAARAWMEDTMGKSLAAYGALPLAEDIIDNVFFRLASGTDAKGNTVYSPSNDYYCYYLRPTSELGYYELTFYDGETGKERVVCSGLSDMEVSLSAEGLLTVGLEQIVGKTDSVTLETVKATRHIVIRLP